MHTCKMPFSLKSGFAPACWFRVRPHHALPCLFLLWLRRRSGRKHLSIWISHQHCPLAHRLGIYCGRWMGLSEMKATRRPNVEMCTSNFIVWIMWIRRMGLWCKRSTFNRTRPRARQSNSNTSTHSLS